MSDEQFQAMLDIHTIVPFRMIRALAPHWREAAKQEKGEGKEVFRKIVNVTSISGTMGNAGQANYSSAKAGVTGLTKTIAKEWGQFKINVNAVAFGFVETRLTQAKEKAEAIEREGEKIELGIPEQQRAMASMIIPLGRPAQPAEAAGPVLFLCSELSNYVHGQVLNVTGGQFGGMYAPSRGSDEAEHSTADRGADRLGRPIGRHRAGARGASRARACPRRLAPPTAAISRCGSAARSATRNRHRRAALTSLATTADPANRSVASDLERGAARSWSAAAAPSCPAPWPGRGTRSAVGLAYLDGHLDLYDGATSPTGEAADMPVAVALGRGPAALGGGVRGRLARARDTAIIGFRDKEESLSYGMLQPEELARS